MVAPPILSPPTTASNGRTGAVQRRKRFSREAVARRRRLRPLRRRQGGRRFSDRENTNAIVRAVTTQRSRLAQGASLGASAAKCSLRRRCGRARRLPACPVTPIAVTRCDDRVAARALPDRWRVRDRNWAGARGHAIEPRGGRFPRCTSDSHDSPPGAKGASRVCVRTS
jgi:hypothetical protein